MLASSSHCQVLSLEARPLRRKQNSEVNTVPKLCAASPSRVTARSFPGTRRLQFQAWRGLGGGGLGSPPHRAPRALLLGAGVVGNCGSLWQVRPQTRLISPPPGPRVRVSPRGGAQTWELCPRGLGFYAISVFPPPAPRGCVRPHSRVEPCGADDKAERAGRGGAGVGAAAAAGAGAGRQGCREPGGVGESGHSGSALLGFLWVARLPSRSSGRAGHQ